jgi:hypothetical protein
MVDACETSDDAALVDRSSIVTTEQTPAPPLDGSGAGAAQPKLPPPINPALRRARTAARRGRAEPRRRRDHALRRLDDVRLPARHLVRLLDRVRRRGLPYGLLTMIVSLEAIFLSTFVMISQNRADAKTQVVADQQWKTVQEEDQQNRELLDLSNQILALTKEVHEAQRNGRTVQPTSKNTS